MKTTKYIAATVATIAAIAALTACTAAGPAPEAPSSPTPTVTAAPEKTYTLPDGSAVVLDRDAPLPDAVVQDMVARTEVFSARYRDTGGTQDLLMGVAGLHVDAGRPVLVVLDAGAYKGTGQWDCIASDSMENVCGVLETKELAVAKAQAINADGKYALIVG